MNLPRPRIEGKARPSFLLNPNGGGKGKMDGVVPGKLSSIQVRAAAAKKGIQRG